MKIRVSLASTSSTVVLAMVVLHSVVGLQGQTKPPTSGGPGRAGVLLVDTDDACRLVLDGQDQGVVKPDQAKRISVNLGDHILKCTIEGIPDLVWRKVIEVKNSEQVAALISLKALHIQYEEAVAKLEKEKNQPTAPTGSVSGSPQAAAPPKPSPSSPKEATVSYKSATNVPAFVVLNVQQAIQATNDGSRDLKVLGPGATQAQQNEIGQRILTKMAPMIVKFAADNRFGVIVDISNPWPKGQVMWVGQQSDITKSIVEIYNGHSASFIPSASNQKVGTINVEQAIFASDDGTRESGALNKRLEPKQAELKGMAAEIEGLKKKINAQASAESRNNLERQIETKQKALNREVQDARESWDTQHNEIRQRILTKMAPVIVKFAADNGFGVIVDISNPWPKGSVIWVGPQVDVTKSIVLAYNLAVSVDRH
jgi:outer membrane protein